MNEREIPAETASSEKYEKVANVPALGFGAQGVVRLVKRKRDEKLLARKKIRYGESNYLEPEYEFLKRFSHANIIGVAACEDNPDRGHLLLYMEYCPYGDLLEFFWQRRNAIMENILWQVLFQVASALAYCHHGVGIYGDHFTVEEEWDGIIHRDIKPSNVLVSSWENGKIVVKICDFGIGKEYVTILNGTSVGTPQYMEPDVSKGWVFKSDIFSLGRTIRALCELNKSLVISPELEKVISKCEEKNRPQRFCAIKLLHSIPAEYFHFPNGSQAKNSTHFYAEGPDISGFIGHLIATVANAGTETERLRRLVCDLEGDENSDSHHRNAVEYCLKHDYLKALYRIVHVTVSNSKKTPLHFAAKTGYLSMVQELVELGEDISTVSQNERTAVHGAAASGFVDVVQKPVHLGVDPASTLEGGWTTLHLAADNGHLEVVEKLVHLGVDPRSTAEDGWTALHSAAQSGHLEVVEKPVHLGADPESTSQDGSTALHFAAQNGHLEVVEKLVYFGADPRSMSQDGSTALHFAAQNGHIEVVEKLVNLGADPRSKSQGGWTALHLAIQSGHLGVAQMLLKFEKLGPARSGDSG